MTCAEFLDMTSRSYSLATNAEVAALASHWSNCPSCQKAIAIDAASDRAQMSPVEKAVVGLMAMQRAIEIFADPECEIKRSEK